MRDQTKPEIKKRTAIPIKMVDHSARTAQQMKVAYAQTKQRIGQTGKAEEDGTEEPAEYAQTRIERGVTTSAGRVTTQTANWGKQYFHSTRTAIHKTRALSKAKAKAVAKATARSTAQAARETARATRATRETARAAVPAAKAAAQAAAKAAVTIGKAVVAAVKEIVSELAQMIAAGGWVAVVLLLAVCVIVLLAAVCMGAGGRW